MKRSMLLLTAVLLAALLALGGCAKLPDDTMTLTIDGKSYTLTNRYTQYIKDYQTRVPSHYTAEFEAKGSGCPVSRLGIMLSYGLPSGTYSVKNGDIVFYVDAYGQDGKYYSNTTSSLPISLAAGGYTLRVTNSTDKRGNQTINGRFSITLGSDSQRLEIQSGEFELHVPANAWD